MSEFNDLRVTELNNSYNENNTVVFNNNHVSNSYEQIQTKSNEIQAKRKTKPQNVNLKVLLSRLVVAVAAVAIVQPTIILPLYSFITPTETPAEVVIIDPSYSFSEVSSSHNKVSFTLSIDNVEDLTKEDYGVIIVEKGNESQDFISSIPLKYIDTYKTRVNTKSTSGSLSFCLTKLGTKNLEKNSDYVLALLSVNKVIKTCEIKTKDFSYITNVKTRTKTDKTKKYLEVQVTPNPEFEGLKSVYFQYINAKTNAILNDYSVIPKEYLDEYWSSIGFSLSKPEGEYKLKLYFSVDDPSKLEEYSLKDYFVKDEITYYYVHTHSGIII